MNRETTDDVVFSLETYLNQPVWNSAEARQRVTTALADGKPVVIREAIARAFAERIHACLSEYRGWTLHESYEGGATPDDPEPFHFRHHNIYDHSLFPPDLAWCRNIFTSDSTKRFIERLSGRACRGQTAFSASWYQPGDYSGPHDDQLRSGDEMRRLAFIWHLAKDWRPEWGGALFWCPTNSYLPPTFNTLVLFPIHARSYHLVTPVSPFARSQRLAVNGWWYGSADSGSALSLETSSNDSGIVVIG